MKTVYSPLHAQVLQLLVAPGESFDQGAVLMVLEAMKMEHEIVAPEAGVMVSVEVELGDWAEEGMGLLSYSTGGNKATTAEAASNDSPATHESPVTPEAPTIRPDLQRVMDRLAYTQDKARPDAVAKRHAKGKLTARENIAALCDGGFVEYGAFAVAAQSQRRSKEDLIKSTPADGMVVGIGQVNADSFGSEATSVVVMAYDATVLAGTQGMRNHQKTDRLLGIALQEKKPVVLFAEGGGGRPGDVDMPIIAGLHVSTFASFAQLNGQVPVVGVVAGRCFAGNAALLGCCDVVIATADSNIGMGGPAMIEGGGLGVFAPEQVGPSAVQWGNGVIDVLVDTDAQAVAAARQYLAYFQGGLTTWQAPQTVKLRDVVPEKRTRVYDSLKAVESLFDVGSVLPLRAGFGTGIHTLLARIEGRSVGVLVNNPLHLGGAIDFEAADKAARFMQLCNAHGLPLISLVDTPGFMVGPAIEEKAQVRHVSRMFVAAAHLRVPLLSVVMRKGYGLGAMAMTGGGFHVPVATLAWPSAEFGAMGLEGAVKLGYKKELDAAANPAERQALYETLLAQQVEKGHALEMAATLEIDHVIDPADTREHLVRLLAATRVKPAKGGLMIDTW